MVEAIEFDVVHEYSLYDVGISVEAKLRSGDLEADAKARYRHRFNLLHF